MRPESDLKTTGNRERILVVRFSSLGDILLTAPTVRALRLRFPEAVICLLVAKEYADAASLIPGVDRILTFDRTTGLRGLWKLRNTLSRRFTILVDLQNSFRSSLLRALIFPVIWVKAKRYRTKRWLLVTFKWNLYREITPVPVRYLDAVRSVGAKDDGRGLELRLPESAQEAARIHFGYAPERLFIALCPSARHFTKRWPKDRWKDLGESLYQQGFAVIVIGAANEDNLISDIVSSIPEGLKIIDRSITEVAAIMERCSAVVSNDSGLMHLAAGVGTPVVGIFGPTVEQFGFFPFRARSRVVEQDLSCRPCSAMGTGICKEGHFRCMLDTTPEIVEDAIRQVLAMTQQET